jgi:hypothetical protein
MRDQFFTSEELAAATVRAVRLRRVERVADFAAGHGDLLRSARQRWPDCFTFGNDVDKSCASVLAKETTVSAHANCDFLNDRSTIASKRFRGLQGNCDVVLLNPPFSGRGCKTWLVQVGSDHMSCSRAMAFVYKAVSFLREGGELVAVLPASCLSSEKDAAIMAHCKTMTEIDIIAQFPKGAFESCSASTTIIRFRNRTVTQQLIRPEGVPDRCPEDENLHVELVRGCVPVYRAENGFAGRKYPFIHSTDIVGLDVCHYQRAVKVDTRCIQGPAVLVARVGSPLSRKCAIYDCEQTIVLSDCVIALRCRTLSVAKKVQRRILENWESLAPLYGGTCAPYLTMNRLRTFLESISITVLDF